MQNPGESIKLEVREDMQPSAPPIENAPLPGHPGGPTPVGWAPLPAQNQIPSNSPPGKQQLGREKVVVVEEEGCVSLT